MVISTNCEALFSLCIKVRSAQESATGTQQGHQMSTAIWLAEQIRTLCPLEYFLITNFQGNVTGGKCLFKTFNKRSNYVHFVLNLATLVAGQTGIEIP
jgi:hypothetical protein